MRQQKRPAMTLAVVITGLGFSTAGAFAQNGAAGSEAPITEEVVIDTAATAALDRMAAYLGTLNPFQVQAQVTTEEVLVDGQKVQLASDVDLVADRPTRLRVMVVNDRQQRLFLYDGKNFVLSAPRLKHYAQTPAPATIIELVDQLEDKYAIDLPLVDLFRWGSGESGFHDLQSARVIGPSECGDVTCMHYVFRQDGLDWQIWLQKGDYPLPRKLVLTTTTDDARPQHTAVYTWNLAPSFNDAAFAFTPPKDFTQIQFEEVEPVTAAAQ